MCDIKPELTEKAAKALADDWNPDRDPVLTAMFRDYAHTALVAVADDLRAEGAVQALRETADKRFTKRQAEAWPSAVADAQRYVDTSTIPTDIFRWTVEWADETRPGRGHAVTAIWCDGEYLVQILMDVYGYPTVSVAETSWLHNSSDEECECEPCRIEARDD